MSCQILLVLISHESHKVTLNKCLKYNLCRFMFRLLLSIIIYILINYTHLILILM